MMAALVVNNVTALTQEMLELEESDDFGQQQVLIAAEKQLRLIFLGVTQWKSSQPSS